MIKNPSKLLSRIEATNRSLPTYLEDSEDKRRSRGGSSGGTIRPLPSPTMLSQRSAYSSGIATPFSRAQGNNAVVLKVLSYGAGARSVRNVLTYQAKDEKAIDQNGREVSDIKKAVEEWGREFERREGSKDVLVLGYRLKAANRDTVASALECAAGKGFYDEGDTERSYAFSTSAGDNDEKRLSIAIVIAHEKRSRADKSKVSRLKPTPSNIHRINRRINGFLRDQGIEPISRFQAEIASGRKGLSTALLTMARGGHAVTISTKSRVKRVENAAGRYELSPERRTITTTDLKEIRRVSKTIASLMRSNQPRDFMHLLISAPANVDRSQFVKAGVAFLRAQFGTHRYTYAVHNRKAKAKHPHLHVIVALRDSRGRRLDPNIRDFTEWRARFAEKARERGIKLEPQKRTDRAAPPPIKRWEWELFHRMGVATPSSLAEKVRAKIHDRPTAPKLKAARQRFQGMKENLDHVIGMLDRLSKDRSTSSTARELSKDLLKGLTREYDRLETAIRAGRDPALEKGDVHMLRTTPITRNQADIAKERVAKAVCDTATKIRNPVDRQTFAKAAKVIVKLVDLQLDSRIDVQIKNRDTLPTLSSTGAQGRKNRVDEHKVQPKTSTRKAVDIGQSQQTIQARRQAGGDEEWTPKTLRPRGKPERQYSNDKMVNGRSSSAKDRDRDR